MNREDIIKVLALFDEEDLKYLTSDIIIKVLKEYIESHKDNDIKIKELKYGE